VHTGMSQCKDSRHWDFFKTNVGSPYIGFVNSWFWNHIRVSRTTNQQYFAKSQKIMTNAQSAEEKEMDDVADLQLSDDEYEILQHKNLF